MGDVSFKQLLAVLEVTKDRARRYDAGIHMSLPVGDEPPELWLVISETHRGQAREVARAPFDPKDKDAAAVAVAKELTIDGRRPPWMG